MLAEFSKLSARLQQAIFINPADEMTSVRNSFSFEMELACIREEATAASNVSTCCA